MSKIPVRNITGDQVAVIEVTDDLLKTDRGLQAIHDIVVAQRARKRQGSASTLTKGEVAGSNKKPWRQKGTGRARAGNRRSPIWCGGGVAFGPKPRKFNPKTNRKLNRAALQRVVAEKVNDGQLVVLENLNITQPKTKELNAIVKRLEGQKGILFVVNTVPKELTLASRNLPRVEVATAQTVNVYQLVRYPKVVITREALEPFMKRLQGESEKVG